MSKSRRKRFAPSTKSLPRAPQIDVADQRGGRDVASSAAILREGPPLPVGDPAFEMFAENVAEMIREILLERAKEKEKVSSGERADVTPA